MVDVKKSKGWYVFKVFYKGEEIDRIIIEKPHLRVARKDAIKEVGKNIEFAVMQTYSRQVVEKQKLINKEYNIYDMIL